MVSCRIGKVHAVIDKVLAYISPPKLATVVELLRSTATTRIHLQRLSTSDHAKLRVPSPCSFPLHVLLASQNSHSTGNLPNIEITSMGSYPQNMANQDILPPEILQNIFSYLATYQPTLHSCTLVSNSWYKSSVAFLYNSPAIDGKNFDGFVKAICPSVNAHVRINGLAALVRKLDMSLLVHNGSKSLTARLLGRVKGNLEEFVAPQASFAYA